MRTRKVFSLMSTLLSVFAILLALPTAVASQAVWVYIDAGHGGDDYGKTTPITGYYEKRINLDVALRLDTLCAWEHRMSRTTDTSVDRTDRANQANDVRAFTFVSIHHNASPIPPGPGAQHTTALWSRYPVVEGNHPIHGGKPRDTTQLLAQKIGFRVRDVFHYGLSSVYPRDAWDTVTVLSRTYMPSVVSEASFVDLYSEAAKFYYNTDDHIGKEAEAIYNGWFSFKIGWGQGIAQVEYAYQNKSQNGDPTIVKMYDPYNILITEAIPYVSFPLQ